jgi:hypothetical protein
MSHCASWFFSEKHILENTFAKCLILLVRVEIPEVIYHLNNHLHYQVFTKVHVPSLVREFLLYWEDTSVLWEFHSNCQSNRHDEYTWLLAYSSISAKK